MAPNHPLFYMRLLLLGSVLLSSWWPSLSYANDQQIRLKAMKSAYSEGYSLYQRKSYAKALSYFSQAHRLAPRTQKYQRFRATMAFFLGSCYAQLKKKPKARKWLRMYRRSKNADPRFRKKARELWKQVRRRRRRNPTRRGPRKPEKTPPTLEEIGAERVFTLPSPRLREPKDDLPLLKEQIKVKTKVDGRLLAAGLLIGAGGAGLIAGIVTNIFAAQADTEARELYAQGADGAATAAEISSRLETARTLSTTSYILYGTSVLLIGAGVAVLFLLPRTAPKPPPGPAPTRGPSKKPPAVGRLLTLR